MEQYLEKCLDSIIGQSYRNLEIILVDDASEDKSGEICDCFANRDNRVRVIHRKKNGGLSAARNSGLDIATGDYIGFADSDDWMQKDMYEFLIDNLLAAGADISICGFFIVTDGLMVPNDEAFSHRVLGRDDALCLLLQDKIIQNYCWCKLYRRELFDAIRMPEGRVFEDIFIQHLIFEGAQKVVLHNIPKYHYVQRKNSLSKSESSNGDYLDGFYGRVCYFRDKGKRHFLRPAALTFLEALNGLYYINEKNMRARAELRERYAVFCRDNDKGHLLRWREKLFYDSSFSESPVISFITRKYRNVRFVLKTEGISGFCQRSREKIGL